MPPAKSPSRLLAPLRGAATPQRPSSFLWAFAQTQNSLREFSSTSIQIRIDVLGACHFKTRFLFEIADNTVPDIGLGRC